MSELEKTKYNAVSTLKHLCARCNEEMEHSCRIADVIREIESLDGIPVIVNSQLRHVVFN